MPRIPREQAEFPRARRDHFHAVVKNFHRTWPTLETGSLVVR
jgi:hypothetical protein